MAEAGESARREYQRRQRKDREKRRRNIKRSLVLVTIAPFATYWLVRAGAWALNEWLLSWMFGDFGISGPGEVLDPRSADTIAKVVAGVVTVRVAMDAWGARPTTESWRKGAEGEVMTGHALDRLPRGYIVLHDLRLPGSPANIDHLVIGPSGVFTVETKNYTSEVVIRRGVARHSGRSMDRVVEQANSQAEAVRRALCHSVHAIICVQGAHVRTEGWFPSLVVDGVRFCSGSRLVEAIRGEDGALSAEEVSRLAAAARQQLGRAASVPSAQQGGGCVCGGDMIIRRRRADGEAFWGCSRYPACRRTLPA